MIEPGQKYQHYKGKLYIVLAVARHSENPDDVLVVYQAQYDCPTFGKNPVWVRPLEMFLENILKDGQEMPRFKKL